MVVVGSRNISSVWLLLLVGRISDRLHGGAGYSKMICILKMPNSEIVGWIIAANIGDATDQAEAIGDHDLARELRRVEIVRPGRHHLIGGYIMLVSSK